MRSLCAAIALGVAATLPTGSAATAELPPGRAAELERLVLQDCGSCHGMTLKGGLGPDLRTRTLAGRSVDDLTEIVLDGVPGTAMPPWHPLLTREEARWIAFYLLNGGTR